MGDPAENRATYADLEALPPHQVGEIIQGTRHALPRRAGRHTRAAGRLYLAIGGPFDAGSGGGARRRRGAPRARTGFTSWRAARLQVLPESGRFTVPPDWVCEVLSPSTAGHDKVRNMPVYAREGVQHVWLVDPSERTLEVFALGADVRVRPTPLCPRVYWSGIFSAGRRCCMAARARERGMTHSVARARRQVEAERQ